MSRAIKADTRVAFVAEVTENVTPVNPAFTIFRATSENLDVMRKLTFSSELNGKRGQKNYAVASASGAGGFNFEFSDETIEAFMESALRGAWASDVLVDAKTPKSFTLETTFEQGATDTTKRLTGAQVATLGLNMRAAEIVTGTIGFMARSADYGQAAVSGATYAAGNAEPIMVGAAIGSIAMSGLTIDCLTAISLNINNNLRDQWCLGSLAPSGLAAGALEVTGTLGMFLDSSEYDVLRAYADGVSTGLEFRLGTTAGKITKIELPNIVLSDLKTDAESAEGDVVLSCNFRALQSAALSDGVIRITRNI